MMKKMLFVISLCTVLVCFGCGKNDNSNNMDVHEEAEYGDDVETYEETEHEDDAETYEEIEHGNSTETYETDYDIQTMDRLEEDTYINKYVVLSDDTEIAGYEWMQCDKEFVLRVKVRYKEKPEDAYQHKEDYFLFIDENEDVSQTLVVDYEDKGIHIGLNEQTECEGNHSLGEGCGFDAYFEDVTFDGRKDLIISVGNSRHAAYYCAYICEDDGFRYEKTFEHIPSYEVKSDEKVICGSDTDGMGWFADMTYEYKDGKFVLTDCVEKEILE